jgi:hypothetical protein
LISKYVANREKDLIYCRTALQHELADPATLKERLAMTDVDAETKRRIAALIDADATH